MHLKICKKRKFVIKTGRDGNYLKKKLWSTISFAFQENIFHPSYDAKKAQMPVLLWREYFQDSGSFTISFRGPDTSKIYQIQ